MPPHLTFAAFITIPIISPIIEVWAEACLEASFLLAACPGAYPLAACPGASPFPVAYPYLVGAFLVASFLLAASLGAYPLAASLVAFPASQEVGGCTSLDEQMQPLVVASMRRMVPLLL